MPSKHTQSIIADSTDPATTRPDIPPTETTGASFHGMNLPDFAHRINLPSNILPSNAWEIFRLFFPTEIICQIVDNTNNKVHRLESEDLKWFKYWRDITLKEVYGYFGIRIYMGLHPEPNIKDYWATGPNKPIHTVSEVMSRDRFLMIYRRIRVAEGDDFETVFKRVSYYMHYKFVLQDEN